MPKWKQPLKGNPFKRGAERRPFTGKSPLATRRTRTPLNLGALGGVVKDAVLNAPLPTGGTVGMAVDSVMPFVDVARDPNLLTGATAAVALPTGGRGPIFLRLVKAANEAQLLGPPSLPNTVLKAFPKLGTAPIRRGRTYVVDLGQERGATTRELDRIVAVQDTKTGNIFLASGGWHHGDLEGRLQSQYGIRGNFQQHELFRADPVLGIPARLNFDVWGTGASKLGGITMRSAAEDTRAATMGRVRFLRELQKRGIRLAPGEQNYGRW